MLTVTGLSVPGKLDGVDSRVRSGEIVGVFGLIGSGIETLGRAVYGALGPATTGTVLVAGAAYRPESARVGKARGIGFVAADRKREGIIGDLTVRENMVAPFQEPLRPRPVRLEGGRDRAGEALDRPSRHPHPRAGAGDAHALRRQPAEGLRLALAGRLASSSSSSRSRPAASMSAPATRSTSNSARSPIAASPCSSSPPTSRRSPASATAPIVLDRGRVVGRFDRGTPPATLMAATTNDPAFNAA